MKTSKEKADYVRSVLDAQKAWKTIEFNSNPQNPNGWVTYHGGTYERSILELVFEYGPECVRIKQEPKLRPWRADEVPVGALIRFAKNSSINGKYLILASDTSGIVYCNTSDISTPSLIKGKYSSLVDYEHSLDHGKTWQPCGVVE